MEHKDISIGRNILIIDKYMKMYLKTALKPYDLNTAEGMVLLALFGVDGLTQDQIIEELHYDRGVMTRTTQALENKGYVVRRNNAEDGRSYFFFLTDKAQSFKDQLITILRGWNDYALKDFDVGKIAEVDSALEKIKENTRLIGLEEL